VAGPVTVAEIAQVIGRGIVQVTARATVPVIAATREIVAARETAGVPVTVAAARA